MKHQNLFCVIAVSLSCYAVAFSGPSWVMVRSSQDSSSDIDLITNTADSVVFIVTIPGFFTEDTTYDKTTYQRLSFPNGTVLIDSGFPELPTVAHSIAIPNCEGVTVTVNAYNPTYLTDYYYQVNIKQN